MLLDDRAESRGSIRGSTDALGQASPSGRASAVLKLTSALDWGLAWVLAKLDSNADPDDVRSGASSERMQEASRRFPIPA